MPIANRKEADDVLALVRALAPAGRTGIGLLTLVPRVPIASTRVVSLLQRHAEYFVGIGGEQKYALNRFGKFEGSAERINADVEQSYERTQRLTVTSLILSMVAGIIGIAALVSLLASK